MLQTIRDKTSGWVAFLFLGLIAVVFVFFGVDFQASTASYAAKVNGEPISAEVVRRAWQERLSRLQQMMRGELPEEIEQQQRTALLDQFVRTSLLKQRVEALGYRVSDEALARRITSIPELQVDGRFNKDRYSALLRQQGLGEAQFEEQFRDELQIEQIQTGIVESAFITPSEADRRYALEQEQRTIEHAMLAPDVFIDTVKVTDAQIKDYYQSHQQEFQTPERADVHYIELTRAQAEAAVSVEETALREYYAQVKDRYQAPERRKARHVLVAVDDQTDDAAAAKLATEVAQKAKSGADFATLAQQYSKDPGSAQQGGDLGWAQRGMFVGAFEDALFAMQPGEIRGPVKSEFGYHIIKLDEIDAPKVRTFEEVRAELEAEYRRDQAESIFYDRSQELADAAFSALTELQSVSEKLNLPIKTINDFTREGGGNLGDDPEVIKAVFSEEVLESRQNSPLIAVGDDRAIVLRVEKHEAAEPKPFDEVRVQIVSRLKLQAAQQASAKQGAEALKRLHSGDAWDIVIKESGFSPTGQQKIGRQDEKVPKEVSELAFNATTPAEGGVRYAGTATANGGYTLVALKEVLPADPKSESAAERDARMARAASQKGNEEFAAYVAELERGADITRNPAVFE